MTVAVPNLSVDGYISNKHTIMSKLFEYFLSTDYSQSNTFVHKIASLKYIINTHKDPGEVKKIITSTLTDMYLRYYNNVSVVVTATITDSSVSYNIDITANDGDGGDNDIKYILTRSIANKKGILTAYDDNHELLYEEGINNG